MIDLVGTPFEVVICPFSLEIRVMGGLEKGIKNIDVAKYVDIYFKVTDDETGEEFCSELVTFSLN